MDKRPGNIRVGQANEYLVANRFAELGFLVSWTHGNIAPYDLIVDWRGRLSRIQVKVTGYRAPESKGYSVSVRRKMRKDSRLTKADCDFLAIRVVGFDSIYIIPIESVNRGNLMLHPECVSCTHTKTHILERFQNMFTLAQ